MKGKVYVPKTPADRQSLIELKQGNVEDAIQEIQWRLAEVGARVDQSLRNGDYLQVIHEVTWMVAHFNLEKLAAAVAELRMYEAMQLSFDGPPGRYGLVLDVTDFREEDRHEVIMDVVENVIRAFAFPIPANSGKEHPAYSLVTKGKKTTAHFDFDVEAGERTPHEYMQEITDTLDSSDFGGRYTIEPLGRKEAA